MPTPQIWRAGSGIPEPAVPAQERPLMRAITVSDARPITHDGDHAGQDLVLQKYSRAWRMRYPSRC